MLMSINMFNAEIEKSHHTPEEDEEAKQHINNIAIVPLTIPFLFGPALISVLIIYGETATSVYFKFGLVVCALTSAIISGLVFVVSIPLMRYIGKTGFNTIERIMGLIIISIAVQFCLDGFKMAFPILGNVSQIMKNG